MTAACRCSGVFAMSMKCVLLIGRKEVHTHTYIQRKITKYSLVPTLIRLIGATCTVYTKKRSFNLLQQAKKLVIARGQGSKFVTKK